MSKSTRSKIRNLCCPVSDRLPPEIVQKVIKDGFDTAIVSALRCFDETQSAFRVYECALNAKLSTVNEMQHTNDPFELAQKAGACLAYAAVHVLVFNEHCDEIEQMRQWEEEEDTPDM